jgi:hypothetical protein
MADRMRLGIAWYKPGQWNELLAVSADRDMLEATWAEWYAQLLTKEQGFTEDGIDYERIEIDIPEVVAWCKARNRPVDIDARATFVAQKIHEKYS